MSLDRTLAHLAMLVACDSQNPPRDIRPDSRLIEYLCEQFPAQFTLEVSDHGDGHVTVLARRGQPRVLFNCHLDTVPVGTGWTVPPLAMSLSDGRARGRGVCDTKGAAACLLSVAQTTDRDMAVLLTTDEEGAEGCCVAEFLKSHEARQFEQVVVCEPTGLRAILAHRGFLSVKACFHGLAGHSSEPRALADNANHRLVRWAGAALDLCASERAAGHDPLFNLGLVSGGTKSNVIADRARLHFSARLAPGQSNERLLEALKGLADDTHAVDWEVPFAGPPLPAAGRDDAEARRFAENHGLPIGDPVGFWTEASLFSRAGLASLVLGPGDIAQAHAVDEWVSLSQLEQALTLYSRLVCADG